MIQDLEGQRLERIRNLRLCDGFFGDADIFGQQQGLYSIHKCHQH
jgi:hypothetical protein